MKRHKRKREKETNERKWAWVIWHEQDDLNSDVSYRVALCVACTAMQSKQRRRRDYFYSIGTNIIVSKIKLVKVQERR